MKNLKHIYLIAVVALLLGACSSGKNVPYLQKIDELPQEVLDQAAKPGEPLLKPGDMLHIAVMGSNAESIKPFNKSTSISSITTSNTSAHTMQYYLVDNNGNIDFPLLGKIHVGGMTKSATENYITSQIYPRYLTEKPNVELRVMNFTVYMIGELNSPGSVQASNGRLNLLEAISKAGDLTLYGQRENVLLIRTDADGRRTIRRFDLTNPRLLMQPEFNLQQNDMIYVQPNRSKAQRSWSMPSVYGYSVSIFSTLVSVTSFVLVLTKL